MDDAYEPDRASRKLVHKAYGYWVMDPLSGAVSIAAHIVLGWFRSDRCSRVGARHGVWFGRLTGRFRMRSWNARARANWIALRPDQAAPAQADAAVLKMWRNITRTLAEFSIVHRLWDEGRVAVEQVENLHAATTSGRPVILMPVHLGNWEVLGPTLVGLGLRVSAIYEPPGNRFDHWLALRARRKFGVEMLPPGAAGVRPALRLLASRERIVSMFGDDYAHGRSNAPFFGRPLRLDGNLAKIARMAALSGALVLPAYVLRKDGGATFAVRFGRPVDLAETDGAPLRDKVERLNAIIEPIVRAHLAQWYWLPHLDLSEEPRSAGPA